MNDVRLQVSQGGTPEQDQALNTRIAFSEDNKVRRYSRAGSISSENGDVYDALPKLNRRASFKRTKESLINTSYNKQFYGYKRVETKNDLQLKNFRTHSTISKCQAWPIALESLTFSPVCYSNYRSQKRFCYSNFTHYQTGHELFCPACEVFFRSSADYHQHLLYVDKKNQLQAQIDDLLKNAGMTVGVDSRRHTVRQGKVAAGYAARTGFSTNNLMIKESRLTKMMREDFKETTTEKKYKELLLSQAFRKAIQSHVYYNESNVKQEIRALREKINYSIPETIANTKLSENRRNSMVKRTQNRIHDLEEEAITAYNKTNNYKSSKYRALTKKYIDACNNLSALEGNGKKTALEYRDELNEKVIRLSRGFARVPSTHNLLEARRLSSGMALFGQPKVPVK